MSATPEAMSSAVLKTKVGVLTNLAPRASLTDAAIHSELTAAAVSSLRQGDVQLVVDLGSVQMLNSAALEMLADIQDRAVRLGGWLKLAHANTIVGDILRLTGFMRYVSQMDAPAATPAAPAGTIPRLGDILVNRGLVSEAQIEEAVELQKITTRRMGQIIIDKGWATEMDVLAALGEQLEVPVVRLRAGIYDIEVVNLLDRKTLSRLQVMPLQQLRGELFLATVDPQAVPVFDEVERRTGLRVRPVLARREDILNSLNDACAGNIDTIELFDDVDEDFELVESYLPDDYAAIDEMAEGSPVINLVNSLVQRAIRDGASDIHIEPSRKTSRVRYRIDGVLYEVTTVRAELHPAIISRLKVMANLDIAERRLPQDGRIQVHTQGRAVDMRFSSLPGLFGEKVVLRVLDKNQALLDVDRLGMAADNLATFKTLLGNTHGLILVTGPTGSGKTTSLYAALNYLNSIEKNIVTIEDPVEYQIEIVNQNEVRDQVGLSFSTILRHTLRQDPDIIMVGEIRDRETAEIAVQAALTGHLVLTTLHTNHAIGAITRMIDMDVEPYLLSSALIGVVAQRLVRTICPACKTSYLAGPELVSQFGWEGQGQIHLSRGRGCSECYDSGYRGRLGIHEMLDVDDGLQRLITANAGRDELAGYLQQRDFRSLFQDGLDHVRSGETTIEEISRVIKA
ncbi:MAG: ATPase, T2SS/T4P/T4SS family [Gammaproteobacteria bacterium]